MGKGHQKARASLLQQMTNDLTALELERGRAVNPLLLALIQQLGEEEEPANQILGSQLERGQQFSRLFGPEEAAAADAARERSVSSLGLQDEDLYNLARSNLTGPSEESLGRIRGLADLATQTGLADLARFRDEGFESIRANAAGRGLRPTDTPILNEFGDLAARTNQSAEQLIRGIRQSQIQQELNYPSIALGQISQASDLLNRRRQFESSLAQRAEAGRLGLGQYVRDTTVGLGTGQPQGARSVAIHPDQAGGGGGLGSSLGGIGQLAGGLGSLYGAVGGTGGLASGAGAVAGGVGSALSLLLPFLALSDARAKTEIQDAEPSEILDKIRAYRFKYLDPAHGEGEQIGILAQELQEAGLGSAVIEGPDGLLRIDTRRLAGPLVAFAADLNKRLRALEAA